MPTDQELQNFQPKCLQSDGTNVRCPIAITATGFVLPCCWLGSQSAYWPKASGDRPDGSENLYGSENFSEDEKIKSFYDEELHIDNNETIEDIINSDMWQNFMSDLINKPEESSSICFKMCSKVEKK